MVQQVLFSHWLLGRRHAEVERSTQTFMHQHSVCAPAPTPRLGRASTAAALLWRPQGAASSS
ncbi:hypothetical protein T492DRAFT_1052277 [Pavlovales sp. CCMP2436]|nr:hypothetical protein T492DRAFT_1052277 [Pavlovales sp. CCMP2436]